MAEPQPPTIHEGATTGDVEDEVGPAKSAEDRKAAAALASLDSRGDGDGGSDSANQGVVDKDAVNKALGGSGAAAKGDKPASGTELKKVKVEAADVALLVDELDLTKPKATELLKAHDGDAVKALRAFIST
ncbi:hypothetical protein GGR56DRAFT_556030 [Xylariaceae sp. FL0804]|nr:hypothetical protein GGR56DRAFT_556030 [Xylariaceae sp. FL0804]